ncbi:MAG: flagellar hook assembly protein FlgD [Gammaproteobacteria bacterium]|nr:flagellar hook assembly protein FlgD [Gammaproteobacteria bacterium]
MTDSSNIGASILDAYGIDRKQADEKPRNKMGQDEFFKLMVTQLQNQDPLNPADSNEFFGQVAQFSTVSGIQDMQKSFETLAASLQSSQALQASTLVGREVLISGSNASLAAGSAFTGAVDLPQSTGELRLNFFDAAGQVVRQVSLGAQQSGILPFSWDGLMDNGEYAPPGIYRVGANLTVDGNNFAADTLISSRVDSVTLGRGNTSMQLNLSDGGSVGLGQVKRIL